VTVPRGATKSMRAVARFEAPIPAPIKAGDWVGTLTITFDGGGTLEAPLQAGADVAETDTIGRVLKGLEQFVFSGG
jgi:D-alanyl-D-alanine carboxypeptidase (penicillin-binding protein 5/6)